MTDDEIEIEVSGPSRSIPMDQTVGVPPGSLPGQFLGHGNTWRYPDANAAFTLVAAQTISALKVVRQSGSSAYVVTSQSTQAELETIAGVALTGGGVGSQITVERNNFVEDGNWAFSPGSVYLGSNGELTQTEPTSGFLVIMGNAVSSTKVRLGIQHPLGL